MATPPATVAEFKVQFNRDFNYGDGTDSIMDSDITKGINEAMLMFNCGLWSTSEVKIAFLYASAHMMVVAVQAAGGLGAPKKALGATNRGGGVIGNKSVGQVSVQYAGLETWVQKYPILSDFLRTDYGAKYLLLLKPRMVGNIFTAPSPRDPDAAIPNIPFVGP